MTPNLNEATSLVNSIPLVKESIPTLMKLANGSNPNIPGYMALGRLQQIKAMIEHSQQPQMPQGTVKENLERSVANMGMMNGRQQQMQQNMMQQGIAAPGPAPEGVPQPQPMPQPEQMPQQPQELMAAHGGILHAQTDPEMFNFAPGGIVAFSGKDKDQEVEDKDKKSKPVEYKTTASQEKERQRAEDRAALLKYPAALADVAVAPARGAINLLGVTAPNVINRVINALAGTDLETNYGPGYDLGEYYNASQRGNVDTGPRASRFTTANDPRVKMADVPASNSAAPSAPAVAPAPIVAPQPARAPRPAVAPAAPAVPAAAPGAAPVTDQGLGALNTNTDSRVADLLAKLTPDNKYIREIDTAQAAAKPEAYDQQKAIADQLALNESLGIGTYGKNRRAQMEQRAKEFEANRMSKLDRLLALGTAFSRPGARAGDVGQRRVELNEAERDAREKFQTAQDALMATVELADEAVRTGNASEILKTKAAKDKAMQDWKAAAVEAKKIQAQAEASRQQTGTQAATSVFGDEMRMQSDREKTASLEKIAAANNVSAQAVAKIQAQTAAYVKPTEQERFIGDYFAIVKSQGQPAADAWLAEQKKIRAVIGGSRYEGQDKEVEREIKVQAEIRAQTEPLRMRLNSTKDPAKQAQLQAQIAAAEKKIRADVARASGDAPPPNAVKLVKP